MYAWLDRLAIADHDDGKTIGLNVLLRHTVNVGGEQAGVRWYELRKQGAGAWAIHQQGTHAPDQHNRWIGSLAMDRAGNIALGYNVASSTRFHCRVPRSSATVREARL